MPVFLFLLLAVLFGLGFLSPLWWVAAAVVLFGVIAPGRGDTGGWARRRGSDGSRYRDYQDYRAYRDYREYQDRRYAWPRRYRRRPRDEQRREERQDRDRR
ncbi:hypothetical protein ABT160_23130 [Streptomyces sp. NPDC001941]|uniref:hypothetical protein n=1 Tax=Streptomyces sp. NPDC001941 TaxID=3154659 RepID=UPI0033289AD7